MKRIGYGAVLLLVPVFLVTEIVAQDDAAHTGAGDSWPVAAVWIQNLEPGLLMQGLEEYARETHDRSEVFNDLTKVIARRFKEHKHFPLEKGTVLVFGPRGIERLDFERVFDREGVSRTLEEFNGQWTTESPQKQPNFEVETTDLGNSFWEVEVKSLTWRAVISNEQGKPTTFEKMPSAFQKHYFRLAGEMLFSSRNRKSLQSARLDKLPTILGEIQDTEGRDRLMTLWVNPQSVPEGVRAEWFKGFEQLRSPQMQLRDQEDAKTGGQRTALLQLRTDLLRAIMFDVDESVLFLDKNTEGEYLFEGSIRPVDRSELQQTLQGLMPTSDLLLESASIQAADLTFTCAAAIPATILQIAGWSQVEDMAAFTVKFRADTTYPAGAAPTGQFVLKPSDHRFDTEIRSVGIPLLTDSLQRLIGVSQLTSQDDDAKSVRVREGDNEFVVSLNTAERIGQAAVVDAASKPIPSRAAFVQFTINRHALRMLRRPNSKTPAEQESIEPFPPIDNRTESLSSLMTADNSGVSISVRADRLAAFELIAVLLSHGIRI